jgi:O-antigen/teichoic acid export membrane protein
MKGQERARIPFFASALSRSRRRQEPARYGVFLEASVYTGSNIAVSLLALVSTALLTRNLTTSEFGAFSFGVTLLGLTAAVFEFGLFSAAARVLATTDALRDRRDLLGAALVVYLPIGAAFSLTVFVLSWFVDGWFDVAAGDALRAASLVSIGVPFVFAGQHLAQGVDRLHISSLGALAGQALVVAVFAAEARYGSLNETSGLVLRSASLSCAGLLVVIWLAPAVRNLAHWVRVLVREAKAWGFEVYVGRLLSMGTYNMDVLMLAIWASAADVGFYALAGSIAAVAALPVTGLATTLYARMAHQERIEARWLAMASITGLVLALAAWAASRTFINAVFHEHYIDAAALVLPLALAKAVGGVTAIYNFFLAAHGRGKDLRNASLVLAGSNLVLNFALIPPYGAMGAAVASLLALIANLVAHVVFYRRHI